MARKSPLQRVEKWKAKMMEGALSPVMKHRLEMAAVKYAVSADRADVVEGAVKLVLNGADEDHPVPMSSVSSYLAFGRQVAKVKERFPGGAATTQIERLKAKWAARGNDPVLMARIVEAL